MNSYNIFLSPSDYFILNKNLIRKIGLEGTLALSELINIEKESKDKSKSYFFTTIITISNQTTLSSFKVKNAVNKLYKKKYIEAFLIKNSEKIKIKILHTNILNDLIVVDNADTTQNKKRSKKNLISKKIFQKPTIQELKNYFLELGNEDESEIMFDYYESKGWKVGKAPMKCWKSATRNWLRRLNKKFVFPDFYDKQFELKISTDFKLLSKYHNYLKQLGWESIYSPSSGKTWVKKTNKYK